MIPLSLLLSAAVLAADPESFERWEKEIAGIEARLAKAMPPKGGVVFAGSSSIRLWNLEKSFPGKGYVNVGFGGSEIRDTTHFAARILLPLEPKAIVFYAGDNDINAGRTPDDVYGDFVQFMRLKEKALGATPVWFISAKPSKSRIEQLAKQAEFNTKVRALADARNDLAYIDVVPAMMKPDGKPKDIFVEDNLHMTPEGYALWTPLVEAALDAGQNSKAPGC